MSAKEDSSKKEAAAATEKSDEKPTSKEEVQEISDELAEKVVKQVHCIDATFDAVERHCRFCPFIIHCAIIYIYRLFIDSRACLSVESRPCDVDRPFIVVATNCRHRRRF